jgi:hypothetical protein
MTFRLAEWCTHQHRRCSKTSDAYREGSYVVISCRATPTRLAFEMLEPYDAKVSCTVLRGRSGRKPRDLPDQTEQEYVIRQ